MTAVQIIIKAVVNGRPDGKFYIGKQVLNGLCHHMGGRMPDGMQSLFAFRCDKFHHRIFFNRIGQILIDPVYHSQKRLFA